VEIWKKRTKDKRRTFEDGGTLRKMSKEDLLRNQKEEEAGEICIGGEREPRGELDQGKRVLNFPRQGERTGKNV